MRDEDQQTSGINWISFCLLAGTIILFGAAAYFLLPSLISKTEDNVEILKAVNDPIKVKPKDPGGKKIDHQGLLVVDILKDGSKLDDQTESLRSDASSPEPPPISVPETMSAKTFIKNKKSGEDKGSVIGSDTNKNPVGELIAGDAKSKAPSNNIEKSIADGPNENKKRNKSKLSFNSSKVKKRVIVIEGDAPLYLVQLAAFRNEQKAKEIAKILTQKHESRLKEVDLKTMEFDTGNNGVFYRIVSAPLIREDADRLCSVLRRSGQDCFLRKHNVAKP